MKFKIGTCNTILILIDQNTDCEADVIKAVNMFKCYFFYTYAQLPPSAINNFISLS